MSLTNEAYARRKFGSIPILAEALGKIELIHRNDKESSADETISERCCRLIELLILINDNSKQVTEFLIFNKIIDKKTQEYESKLLNEINYLINEIENTQKFFSEMTDSILKIKMEALR